MMVLLIDADSTIPNLALMKLSAYCNQPGFFKKVPFETFLGIRHTGRNKDTRISASLRLYNENLIGDLK